MRLKGIWIGTVMILFITLVSTTNAHPRAPEFALKDQYGKVESYRFPKSQVSILIFGDRKGSSQIEGWVRPLYERYQERVNIKGIAALSSVPALARGVVTRIFKSKVKYSVLLDWTGNVAKSYSYEANQANVFVISPQGEILLRLNGEATQSGLDQVISQINKYLR
jgi:hypothetical protein